MDFNIESKFEIEILRASLPDALRMTSFRYFVGPKMARPPQREGSTKAAVAKSLVARNSGIDFQGPAIDASGERFRGGNALLAEPVGYVEAAHPVVAVTDDRLVGVELLEIRGDRSHGDKHGAFNTALRIFPGFADVDEEDFLVIIETLFKFGGGNFQIVHWTPESKLFGLSVGLNEIAQYNEHHEDHDGDYQAAKEEAEEFAWIEARHW